MVRAWCFHCWGLKFNPRSGSSNKPHGMTKRKKKKKETKRRKKIRKKERKQNKKKRKALNTDFNGYTFHGRQNSRFSLGK